MKDLIVIKVGGNALDQLTSEFFEQLTTWRQAGKQILLVHGGGPMISKLCQKLNVPVTKTDGVRVTDEQTLALTKLVLLGQTQPLLLQKLSDHHLNVQGLNAASNYLLKGRYLDKDKYGQVGAIIYVNQAALMAELKTKIGVLAPLALTESGEWLNVNADQAALAVASKLKAEKLYLLTDVAGVLANGKLVAKLSESTAAKLVQKGIITSGMFPKVKAALTAQRSGISQVFITNSLAKQGTQIESEE